MSAVVTKYQLVFFASFLTTFLDAADLYTLWCLPTFGAWADAALAGVALAAVGVGAAVVTVAA